MQGCGATIVPLRTGPPNGRAQPALRGTSQEYPAQPPKISRCRTRAGIGMHELALEITAPAPGPNWHAWCLRWGKVRARVARVCIEEVPRCVRRASFVC
jgi:hypothetical protein